MADKDGISDTQNYFVDVPMASEPYTLRGSNSLDWGFKNRLSNIFRPETGRTVMLAIDHGYFLGPTAGLERMDPPIVPLLPYADTLMCTRGILRSTIPPTFTKGIVLRSSGGPSILKELSNEEIAVDVEDAVRLNVAARICAELGAAYVKTYFVAEGFDTVTASCPVPIVIAGGKKLPEPDALKMAYDAAQQGAAGGGMGA